MAERPGDDEGRARALLRLGECYAALQRWARSEEAFAERLRAWPDDALWFQAQFGVGWALENQGRFGQAISAYQKVLDHHQGATAARAQFQIGECLFAENKFDDAARELLGAEPRVRALEALKFPTPLRPGDSLELEVEITEAEDVLRFALRDGERTFASGRCRLEADGGGRP